MTKLTPLESDRIKLRALEPEDLNDLYRWENDLTFWSEGNAMIPYSKYILRQYITRQSDDIYVDKQLRLMIEDKATTANVGTIDLYDFDPKNMRAGVGIIVDPKWQKANYATEALTLLKDYVFSVLHLKQIYSVVNTGNVASCALFRKCGFDEIGVAKSWIRVNETWQDCYIYQKISDL